jgi:nucleoside-diphosphate-sugar epimerase
MGTDLTVKCPPVAILVTGVGYIGATLLRRLAASDLGVGPDKRRLQRIVAMDNFFCTARAQVEAAVPPETDFVQGDVAEPRDVARAFDEAQPRAADEHLVVFHLAAQPSAAIAASDPAVTERTNLVGSRLVLEAARACGARVVFGGSFRVYGDDLTGQVVEEDRPYGRVGDLSHLSKIYVEQLAGMIDVPFVSVRLGVTYGRSPIMKSVPAFMTVPNLFCKRAVDGEVLRVHEDRPVAFVHVEDAVTALLAAAGSCFDQPSETSRRRPQMVNAATEVVTIGQLARLVQCLAARRGLDARIAGPVTEGDQPVFEVRTRLDLCAPGYFRHALADSLGDVLDYFLSYR